MTWSLLCARHCSKSFTDVNSFNLHNMLSCSVLSDTLWPHGCSLPGSSVHGIPQARVLEWVTMPSSRGSSWHRYGTWISCIAGGFFTVWATGEAQFALICLQSLRCLWPEHGINRICLFSVLDLTSPERAAVAVISSLNLCVASLNL